MGKRRSKGMGEMLNLDGLFDLGAMDGLVEDAIDLGTIGAGIIVGNIGARFVQGRILPMIPLAIAQDPRVQGAAIAAAGIGAGILGTMFLPKAGLPLNIARNLSAGIGGGMVAQGVGTLLASFGLFGGGAVAGIPCLGGDCFGFGAVVSEDVTGLNGFGVTGTDIGPGSNLLPLSAPISSEPGDLRPLRGYDNPMGHFQAAGF